MVELSRIVGFLDAELRIASIPDYGGAVNGLQLENPGQIGRIVAAVDASLPVVEAAAEGGPGLLLVHHGMFWQGVQPVGRTGRGSATGTLRGVDGVARVVEQLAGAVMPASALETHVLPARVTDYQPAMLDELTAAGEVVWAGHGALAGPGQTPQPSAPLLRRRHRPGRKPQQTSLCLVRPGRMSAHTSARPVASLC